MEIYFIITKKDHCTLIKMSRFVRLSF